MAKNNSHSLGAVTLSETPRSMNLAPVSLSPGSSTARGGGFFTPGRASLGVSLALGVSLLTACGGAKGPDPFALMEGETIYKMECAVCHGARMEGQENWRVAKADGSYPAPPLNATGKTLGMPRDKLLAAVKQGGERVVENHAFGKKMTEKQLESVVVFIESRWANTP